MRTLSGPVLAAAIMVAGSAPAGAQDTGLVRTDENLRREPNGERLGVLMAGTPLVIESSRDGWLEVVIEGWVWERSLQIDERQGLDLVVSEAEGENLRDAPSGEVVGRLAEGTLLEEVRREPGWILVRRTGWIWEASVALEAAQDAAMEATDPPEEPAPAERVASYVSAPEAGTPVLTSPDGDTLANAMAGAELEVLAREGSWVRVRIEGWAWMPPNAAVPVDRAPGGGVVTPETLAADADPSAHRGTLVAWSLQFISLERAERVRTDFFEGEPFLLCRFGDAQGPFVYVAVPPERAGELEGLVPLEQLSVTGRVRTGSSALTGTPIIDLLALTRARDTR